VSTLRSCPIACFALLVWRWRTLDYIQAAALHDLDAGKRRSTRAAIAIIVFHEALGVLGSPVLARRDVCGVPYRAMPLAFSTAHDSEVAFHDNEITTHRSNATQRTASWAQGCADYLGALVRSFSTLFSSSSILRQTRFTEFVIETSFGIDQAGDIC